MFEPVVSYAKLLPRNIRLLTADEIRDYYFSGCVLVEDVFDSDEISTLQDMTAEVLHMPSDKHVTQAYETTKGGEKRLCRVEGFIPRHVGFAALARERLAPLAAQLFGEECYLFKEKMNIKHAHGGGGYAAHFDGPSAAAAGLAERFITAQVAIDDQTVENGALQVVMPRHACPWLNGDDEGGGWDGHSDEEECAATVMIKPKDGDPDAGGRIGAIDPTVASSLPWQAVPCKAGSVLLFHGLFPHRSAANMSGSQRRTGYFLFNAASDGGDCHEDYKMVMAETRRAFASTSTTTTPSE
jgi:hypothetical protein